jgi:spore coat polysaccharide biosynthesis predicted glycosyltransferase SpsG
MRDVSVLFLSRGSVADGLGHVMRSRAVAREVARTHDVRFVVVGDDSSLNLLARYGLDHVIVPTVEDAVAEYTQRRPKAVVFDLLDFPAQHVEAFGEASRLVSLSPIFDQQARMDCIFHRSAVTPAAWADELASTTVRAGLTYAVLGEHVERIPAAEFRRGLERTQRAVAVSMGGADAANNTLELVRVLGGSAHPFILWVMLGEGYSHSYEEIARAIQGSRHEIILAKTNESMWRILQTCSLAVLAGGITTYEAAFAGLPSVNVLAHASHRFLLEELEERGACRSIAGDPAAIGEPLGALIDGLVADPSALLRMHLATEGLIDGLGAQRIALEIGRLVDARESGAFLPPAVR